MWQGLFPMYFERMNNSCPYRSLMQEAKERAHEKVQALIRNREPT